jgi:hypothetical protein
MPQYPLVLQPRLAHAAHKGKPSRGARDGYPRIAGVARRRAGHSSDAAAFAWVTTVIILFAIVGLVVTLRQWEQVGAAVDSG